MIWHFKHGHLIFLRASLGPIIIQTDIIYHPRTPAAETTAVTPHNGWLLYMGYNIFNNGFKTFYYNIILHSAYPPLISM